MIKRSVSATAFLCIVVHAALFIGCAEERTVAEGDLELNPLGGELAAPENPGAPDIPEHLKIENILGLKSSRASELARFLRSNPLVATRLEFLASVALDSTLRARLYADGVGNCGPDSRGDCGESILVPGGTLYRSAAPRYPATVSDFRMDKYAITVGRMREFVAWWLLASAEEKEAVLSEGSGKHTHLNGGLGLETHRSTAANRVYEPGWKADWNARVLPEGAASLKCDAQFQTWADAPNGGDRRAQNCLSWYEAYAFCIRDGGFLPSDAEFKYVAVGGPAADGQWQREYPWSDPTQTPEVQRQQAISCSHANYYYCDPAGVSHVGSRSPIGDSKHGFADVAGNVWQWNLDSFADIWASERPFADDTRVFIVNSYFPSKVQRGGSFTRDTSFLLSSFRGGIYDAKNRHGDLGARCARTP